MCVCVGATCWPFLESLSFHFFSLSCASDSQHTPHHRTHHSPAATHTLSLPLSLHPTLAFNTFKSLSVFPDNLQWLPHSLFPLFQHTPSLSLPLSSSCHEQTYSMSTLFWPSCFAGSLLFCKSRVGTISTINLNM